MKKYFYERSNLLESKLNINFDELLYMSTEETHAWIEKLRLFILNEWNNNGIPPTIGQTESKIISNFKKLRSYPLHHGKHKFLIKDEDTNEFNVIKNFNKFASAINQFFPTMLKTRIGTKKNATSIYDYFTDEYKEAFHTIMMRTLKRDSMYSWSKCVTGKNAFEWIEQNKNFFIVGQRRTNNNSDFLTVTSSDIKKLYKLNLIDELHITNLPPLDNLDDDNYTYFIREFIPGQKLFPAAIQVFRLGLGQPAVNFPPLTARYLYETYTNHINQNEKLNIYDPSAGWGGRILGAMASHRNIHYIGTDPNTDNFINDLNITRYEYVANFFNKNVLESNSFWEDNKNTYHIFRDGSEYIKNNAEFQQYKGKLDLIFTSPPYFNREQYSEDEAQSFKMYPKYDAWRDNFLKPTLITCFKYLKSNRYILWNISDIKISKDKYYSLEQDSIDILTELGMEYKGKLKMLMTTMVGLDPKHVKNSVKVNNSYMKYEPILIFYKK